MDVVVKLLMFIRPSAPTFVSVIDACAQEALIGRGKQVHGQIIRGDKSGNLFNVYVCNALIDMYAKCGDMKSAENLFEMAPMRDVVTWNILISGFAQNGHGEESSITLNNLKQYAIFWCCTKEVMKGQASCET